MYTYRKNDRPEGAEDFGRVMAITNRTLCRRPFLEQIERMLDARPNALLLREKDLNPEEYALLAREVMGLCQRANVPCFLHGAHLEAAYSLGCQRIHVPFAQLKNAADQGSDLRRFAEISVSCHSLEEVRQAQGLGAARVVLGTIFPTACKPGHQGAGLEFLREACRATALPVFATGGVTMERLPAVLDAGAAGACMMSAFCLR